MYKMPNGFIDFSLSLKHLPENVVNIIVPIWNGDKNTTVLSFMALVAFAGHRD